MLQKIIHMLFKKILFENEFMKTYWFIQYLNKLFVSKASLWVYIV